ncbi:MAG TPA: hypothetical protein VEB59_05985, partial [Gemmatimonadales bacterium]|nr:hypothetical protein [Gemmatimonadales bacterium]
LKSPEPDLDRAFAIAAARAEALLADPGGATAADRIRVATSLLGAGVRAPARELLRRRQRTDSDREATAELENLSRHYHAWVGEAPGTAGPPDDPRRPASLAAAAGALARDPDDPAALVAVLDAVVRDLWGLGPDAPGAAITIRPELPGAWAFMALARVRVGRTVLDLEVRRRRESLAARVHRAAGPAVVVTLELHPRSSGPTFVDDVELRGPRVRFEAVERHEIVAHRAAE